MTMTELWAVIDSNMVAVKLILVAVELISHSPVVLTFLCPLYVTIHSYIQAYTNHLYFEASVV